MEGELVYLKTAALMRVNGKTTYQMAEERANTRTRTIFVDFGLTD